MVNICCANLCEVLKREIWFSYFVPTCSEFLKREIWFWYSVPTVLSFLREKFGFRKFSNLSRLVQYTCVENVLYTQYNQYADCERRPVLDRSFKDMPVH